MPSGTNLQEYLVKLGVNLDVQNMNKMEAFLKSSKVQAAALSGSLVALGTIIYKFVKSTTEAEYNLRNLAKTQKKTVEATRAQENALKAMGKTADQIKKDGSLNAIYKDIVKINKEMALPNMDGVLANVTKLRGEFYSLKSTIQYALQWVNYYLLNDLREPILQITEMIRKGRTWLQTNLKQITKTVTSYITGFTKGLLGIVDGAKQIVQLFNRLPNGIRGATTAIMALYAIIKSGPIGQLLMAVEAVGGLIHDYDNYNWNKANPDKEQVPIAFPTIWELLSGDGSSEGKAKGITDLIVGKLKGTAEGLATGISTWVRENKDSFSKVTNAVGEVLSVGLGAAIDISGALIEGLTTITSDPEVQQSIGSLFETIFTDSFGMINDIGGVMVSGLSKLLSGKTSAEWETEFGKDAQSNKWLGALGTGIIAKMFGASDQGAIALSIASLIAKGFGADDGQGLKEGENGYEQLKAAGGQIMAGLIGGLDTATDIAGDISKTIGMALTGMKQEDWNKSFGEDNSWVTAFGGALVGKLFGLSWGQSALVGMGTAIADAFTDTKDLESDTGTLSKLWTDMRAFGGTIWTKITDGLTAVTDWWNGDESAAFRNDLNTIGQNIADTLFGAKDDNGKRSGGLWEKLAGIAEEITSSDVFQSITAKIQEAFSNAFDGLWAIIGPKLNMLWVNMYNSMPDWLKTAMGWAGIENPNYTAATYDNNTGKTTISSTDGGTVVLDDPGGQLAAIQNEYGLYRVNKDGKLVITDPGNKTPGQADRIYNHTADQATIALAEGDYRKLEYIAALYAAFREGKADPGLIPWNGKLGSAGANGGNYVSLFDDLGRDGAVPEEFESAFTRAPDGTVVLKTALDPNTKEARRKIEQDLQKPVTVPVNAQIVSGDNTTTTNSAGNTHSGEIALPQSRGTRTNGPMHALIGEDGTEYVIPITKPSRAISLITQMLSEMGGSAVNAILDNLGISGASAGTVGGSLASSGSLLSGGSTTITYNNNVSAPVTITVQPSAASSQDVGNRVYSLTERYLLRTVQGVLA